MVKRKAHFTPDSILPTGVDSTILVNPYTGESGPARKGTIAATLNNVARLNTLLSQSETRESIAEIEAISQGLLELMPSLQVVGLFDFFEPIYWIGEGEQPGRVLAVILYFRTFPQKCSSVLKKKLSAVSQKTPSAYLKKQLLQLGNSK